MTIEGLAHADVPQKRGAEHTLAIQGARSVPQQVDTGSIKYTCDLDFGGFGNIGRIQYFTLPLAALAGLSELITPCIISGDNLAATSPIETRDENCRILTMSLQVSFNAAGALAFNNLPIDVSWRLNSQIAPAASITYNLVRTVYTSLLYYNFALPYPTACPIPDKHDFDVIVFSPTLVAFPAGTQVEIQGAVIIKPITSRLPF